MKAAVRIESEVFTGHVRHITVNQRMGEPTTMTAVMDERTVNVTGGHLVDWLGKTCEIEFTRRRVPETTTHLHRGYIRAVSIGDDNAVYMEVVSPDARLRTGICTEGFERQPVIGILKTLLDRHRVPHAIEAVDIPGDPPWMQRFNETAYHFIMRLAARYALFVYDNGGRLRIRGKPDTSGTNTVELVRRDLLGDTGRLVAEVRPSSTRAVARSMCPAKTLRESYSGRGPASIGRIAGKVCSASTEVYDDATVQVLPPIADSAEVNSFLEAQGKGLASSMVRFYGRTDHPHVVVGVVVSLSDHPLVDEDLLVVETAISQGTSDYRCEFAAIPVSMASGCVELPSPIRQGLALATVIDNLDENELGRVKIRFFDDENAAVWARVLSLSAGKEHGMVWTPAVGDEVVVSFVDGNPNEPLVLGSLYHEEHCPRLVTPNGSKEVLLAQSRRGTQIRIVEGEGNTERVEISQNDSENTVNMVSGGDSEPKIVIHTTGQCDISAKSLRLTADEDLHLRAESISVEAGQTVELKGSSVAASAEQSMKIDGTSVSLKAGGEAVVKGAIVRIN